MRVPQPMRLLALGFALAVGLTVVPAQAEPLPVPSGDFSLKARLRDNVVMDLWHAGDRMRVTISGPRLPAAVVGIVDMRRGKMLMLMPDIPNTAVETNVPAAYGVAVLAGEGERTGTAQVAGEPCTLWRIESAKALAGPATSCITQDGIALKTDVAIKGKPETVYEVTSLVRGPQPADLFRLPPGTQLLKVPPGAAGFLPGLSGLRDR